MSHRVTNRTFDSLRTGDIEHLRRDITQSDIRSFVTFAADVTGHAVDRELAADPRFRAMLSAGGTGLGMLISLIASRFPGLGSELRSLSLDFSGALREGDTAIAEVRVAALDEAAGSVVLDCLCRTAGGDTIVSGKIEVTAPTVPLSRPFGRTVALEPDAAPDRLDHIEELGRHAGRVRTAVVNPTDGPSLAGALDSAEAGLIEPVLIAPLGELGAAADAQGLDLSGIETIDAADADDAAGVRRGTRLSTATVRGDHEGKDSHRHAPAARWCLPAAKLCARGRRLSHVFRRRSARIPRLLFVADAAVNIRALGSFDLCVTFVQNTIDLRHAVGIERPNVAFLSAVETGDGGHPSTIPPPRSARWRTGARSPARMWTVRSPSTTQSPSRPRGSRGFPRRWPVVPTS